MLRRESVRRLVIIDGPDSWAKELVDEKIVEKFYGIDFTDESTIFDRCLAKIKEAEKVRPFFWTQRHHTQVHARFSLHWRDVPCAPAHATLGSAHCWEAFQDPCLLCILCCWDSRTTCCSRAFDLDNEAPEHWRALQALGQIDGVCSFWEAAQSLVASLAERLGLLAHTPDAVEAAREKQVCSRLYSQVKTYVLSVSHRNAGSQARS